MLPGGEQRVNGQEYPISRNGCCRCEAFSVQTGSRCGQYACYGHTRCKKHGGYVKYESSIKSPKLREAYLRYLSDKTLTDQRDDLALMRALCEILVERHSDVEDAELGADKMYAIAQMLMQVDKLVKSITDREIKMANMVHVDQMAAAISKITEVITRHVRDQEMLRKIVTDITAVELPALPAPNGQS